jgi:hypothetical protein
VQGLTRPTGRGAQGSLADAGDTVRALHYGRMPLRLLGPRSVWPVGPGANAQETCLSLYEHALNDHEQHEEEMHPQPEPHSRADNQHPSVAHRGHDEHPAARMQTTDA